MSKNTNAQISNFMDGNFKFEIRNNGYSLDYESNQLTFSELENIIKSNYKYWEEKSNSYEMANPILNNWKCWREKFGSLKDYLENSSEFNIDEVHNFSYSHFSTSYTTITSTNIRLVYVDINSPINKDQSIAIIRLFIDFYLKSWAKDSLLNAIENYICIEKNKNCIGQYLNYTEPYRLIPALFVLNKELPKAKAPFKNFQKEVVEPVSETVKEIAFDTQENFKQTTALIEEKDEAIRELFDSHSQEINDFKENFENWQDDKENAIKILEDTYKNKLQLEAPETLWKERSKNYKVNNRYWMGGLAVFIIALISSAGGLLVRVHDYLKGALKDIPFISQSFVYVALISFLIYLVRVMIKIIISNQHMAMEYEQKEALTRFYQALVYDGKDVEKEERLIIFNALFSKTDTGLVKVDNSNDSEALLAILSKISK
ncbi:MAG: DUF6161 domain-containing protein [Streptococcus mutans]|uniref:DUF6161 domain-containing protein n=1 Tax=Streptococcus mutans TaxID=1309 RepID=UPI001425F359|nr:DUF6161 domain-containing protein [Streptococcus mutans]QIQ93325.1 hypothetical protein HB753_01985 [Streptococcus mutans]QIQ99567.1 hypothetical protein HB752_01985 [Streptococcus mutans]QIR01217.1 hypothetical protein HB751_00600 [Streptococcus mutans]QIR03345.1 hypothetical protein HB750_01985 [Streptococcus mutans]